MKYSPKNIKVACDHKGLTHFGGVYFFHEFLRVVQRGIPLPAILSTRGGTAVIICRR